MDAWVSGALASQSSRAAGLLVALGSVGREVVEVRDRDEDARARRELDRGPVRRPLQPQVDPLDVAPDERLADQQAVAVFRSTRPAPERRVAPLSRCTDQPILLHHVDDLLEPQQVGLQRCHVGQDQREPFGPAVRQVEDVVGGDVETVHRITGHDEWA